MVHGPPSRGRGAQFDARHRLAASIVFGVVLATPATALATPLTIDAIVVGGNRRTDEHVIRQALRIQPGDAAEPGPAPELGQRLMNLHIFQDASVVVEPDGGGGAVVRVTVVERWTLIVVPMAAGGGGSAKAGIAITDTNAFGKGLQLGIMGFFGTSGSGGLVTAAEPHVAGDLSLQGSVGRTFSRLERRDRDGVAYAFDMRTDLLSAEAGWLLHCGAAQIRAGWWWHDDRTSTVEGYATPPRGGAVQGPSLELRLGQQDFHLDHVTGTTATARLETAVTPWSVRARTMASLRLDGAWSLGAATLSTGGSLQAVDGGPSLDAIRLGGQAGSRGLPLQGAWAERTAFGTIDAQVPLWHLRWGTLAGATFVDAGALRWRGDTTSWVSPGAGLRLFLRGIALPALGFDVAWRVGDPRPAFTFSIGLGGSGGAGGAR